VGDFMQGVKHGKGKWKKTDGPSSTSYEGEYVLDKKQGYGIFRWASGNTYIGTYNEDERHGIGIMSWTDASKYIGQWERGI
jgi:hypothetical protein